MKKTILIPALLASALLLAACGKLELRVRNDTSFLDIAGARVGTAVWTNIANGTASDYQVLRDGQTDVYVTFVSSEVYLGSVSIIGSSIISTKWTVSLTDTNCSISKD